MKLELDNNTNKISDPIKEWKRIYQCNYDKCNNAVNYVSIKDIMPGSVEMVNEEDPNKYLAMYVKCPNCGHVRKFSKEIVPDMIIREITKKYNNKERNLILNKWQQDFKKRWQEENIENNKQR